MKILCVADERRVAQAAANALRGIAPNVTLTWAEALSPALHWVQHNRDAAAVIVEAEVRGQSCRSLVDHVRGLGLTTPIVVVVREHFRPPLPYFGADDVVCDESLHDALSPAITRALQRLQAADHSADTTSPLLNAGRFGRADAAVGHPRARGAVEAGVPNASMGHEELAPRLAQEMARRAALEQDLATAESARRCAERQHVAELEEAEARHADERAQHQRALTRNTRICTELQEKLLELEAEVRHADERRASEAARFAEEGAQRETALTRTARVCAALQERLLELEAAQRDAEEQRASQAAAAADHLAQRHAEFTASLKQAAHSRDGLARRLSVTMAALEEARQARATDTAAATERLAAREEELNGALAEAVAARAAVERVQADAEASHQQSQQRAAADLAAAADRQAALEDRLTQEVAARTTVEERLGRAEAAQQETEQRHASEVAAVEARLADVQTKYDAAVDQVNRTRMAFERQLAEVTAAREEATRIRASESATAAERLAARETELGVALADAVTAWTALERVQAEAAAHQQDLAAAAERYAVLEHRFTQEVAARTSLEQTVVRAEAARHEAEKRHGSELAVASTRLADVQAQFDGAVEQTNTARVALEQQLAQVTAALEAATQSRVSDAAIAAERLMAREAELGDALAGAIASRTAAERAQAEAEALHRAASARMRRRVLGLAAGIRQRTREQRARLDDQLAREREGSQRALRASQDENTHLEHQRESLQVSLDRVQLELQRLNETYDEERREHERLRLASESEVHRLAADRDRARQSLHQVRAAFDTLEEVASAHAAERARLEGVVADHDAQLSAQAARQVAAEQAASSALAQIQDELRQARDTSSRDHARLQREIDTLRRELDVSHNEGEALRNAAERVPALLKQLDEAEQDRRQQFERSPYGMCRCSLDGALTRVNHALVRLLEYRNAEELQAVDLAKAVFESPADLRWLIERARGAGPTDWVETAWKTRNRRSLVVRLRLRAVSDGRVDIEVEDVTRLRAAEERLRQAHRMEAVGRLASEVAGTCGAMLRSVSHDGRQWLSSIDRDPALRDQGELLFGEVTRAAGLLRQLAVYGDTQVRNLEPVDVGQVLHDVAPVLKRVAGDDVELTLAKGSARIDVDVDAERVERVLVNVASYARQRLPHGGRLKIDLATTVVDSRFVATYPNVRPGAHALITVTEMREDIRSLPAGLRIGHGATDLPASVSDRPAVDLSALVRLLGGCGGHLWMMAEPPGNLTLKIYLPMRAGELLEAGAPVRTNRGRSLIPWFRH